MLPSRPIRPPSTITYHSAPWLAACISPAALPTRATAASSANASSGQATRRVGMRTTGSRLAITTRPQPSSVNSGKKTHKAAPGVPSPRPGASVPAINTTAEATPSRANTHPAMKTIMNRLDVGECVPA